jgi:hypothetical protein
MKRCATDAAFRIILGNDIPDFRRIAEFRARHLKHLPSLFLEVLVLCREAGLLKVGRLSLDGTKVKASASRNSAMSYDHRGPKAERLQQETDALLALADGPDAATISRRSHLHYILNVFERPTCVLDPNVRPLSFNVAVLIWLLMPDPLVQTKHLCSRR